MITVFFVEVIRSVVAVVFLSLKVVGSNRAFDSILVCVDSLGSVADFEYFLRL